MIRRPLVRRAVLASAAGLALYAGHPPLRLGWLGLLALVPLSALARDLLHDRRPLRSAFAWGMLAGGIFFGPLLVWIVNTRELAAWLFLVPVQAVFIGGFLVALVAWGTRPWRPLALVIAWVAFEALRSSTPLGGFPWGVLGYTQHDGGPLLAIARSFGVLGVSAGCAAVAAAVEETWARVFATRGRPRPASGLARSSVARGPAPALAVLGVLLVGAPLAGGTTTSTGPTLDIAAIQGFDVEGSTGRTLPRSLVVADKMREVTARAVADGGVPDVVIWPENAIDGDVSDGANPELAAIVQEAIDLLDGAPLLAGVISDGDRPATFENTVVLFDEDAQQVDRYVKRQLVPFGEYVPARRLLDWFPPLDRVPSDGIPGDEPRLLTAAGADIGAVICFEVIFPSLVHDLVREGADILVVATNNTSFGRGAASDQHLAFSQLRAVESGRWVVHAALSGISALVDPGGGVHQSSDLYRQAVVRADVPLVTGTTLATRVGDGVGHLALLLAAVGALWLGLSARRTRRVAGGAPGKPGAMDDLPQHPGDSGDSGEDAPTREEIREALDEHDPVGDLDDEEGDERQEDQAWAGSGAMQGEQPTG